MSRPTSPRVALVAGRRHTQSASRTGHDGSLERARSYSGLPTLTRLAHRGTSQLAVRFQASPCAQHERTPNARPSLSGNPGDNDGAPRPLPPAIQRQLDAIEMPFGAASAKASPVIRCCRSVVPFGAATARTRNRSTPSARLPVEGDAVHLPLPNLARSRKQAKAWSQRLNATRRRAHNSGAAARH
jgi:hypothetical protein